MDKFFAYDPETGFELFGTESEAESFAQDCIDIYREEAAEGWPDSVEQVCWGQIRQYAQESTYNAGDEEAPDKDYSDYHLQDIA